MSLPVSALPRCVAIIFQEQPKQFLYLRGGHAKREDYVTFSELSFDKELESSMHTRFYLDPSPSKEHGEKGFVHVRCAYNNKYLVAKEVKEAFRKELKEHDHPDVKFLMDMADEPEEDVYKPSCTLFIIRESKSGSKYEVSFDRPGLPSRPGTEGIVGFLSSPDTNKEAKKVYSQMILIDVTEQIILPPYVAFKGDNDLYLTTPGSNKCCLSFSPSDITEKSVRFTTHNYADGTVHIKSVAMDKFLRVKDKIWIGADVTIKESTTFKAFKYGDLFAFQAVSGGKFLSMRPKNKGKEDNYLLAADSADITPRAKFRLEEPVINRDIYNVQYHRKDHARIYDITEMKVAAASAINGTSEKNTVRSTLSITTKESSKWEATATHKASVSVSTSAGFSVPFLGGVDIEAQFGYEFSHATNWGTSVETEKKQDIQYEVTVPANKKVTLTVTAKQAKYDVPFSYTQRDMLPNGEKKIYNYDDGLYSGLNCFDLRYKTKEEDIPTEEENHSNKRRRL